MTFGKRKREGSSEVVLPREALAEQFNSLAQEKETSELGMWVFLSTEVLFFGGLLCAYVIYRSTYPEGFAKASRELDATIGGVNTMILLTSSFFMALATRAAQEGDARGTRRHLLRTWMLGATFLIVKAHEYHDDFEKNLYPSLHGGAEGIFYWIYYAATGLHAIHLTVGLGVILWLMQKTHLGPNEGRDRLRLSLRVEIGALYWHFVDVVWVFLWPLLYLVDRHSG